MKDYTLLVVFKICVLSLFVVIAVIFVFGDSPESGECECELPSTPSAATAAREAEGGG